VLRVVFTIVLPLVLPTAVYLAWVGAARWVQQGPQHGGTVRRAALPWVRLAGAGALLLLAVVLFVAIFGIGTTQQGVYVPPRWENGHIVPGHVEPRRGQ
jgi:hypothetical protein